MNLEKLKDSARKFEQKEDWRRAIEVYLKAIQQIESGAESSPDLSLYNRVGDLYLKTNDTASAVRSYERAVDLYADQGFFNNAIALCGKILRVNPGRTQTYLKLAQLHARKNVVIEAKRNLIEFLERMNALGQLDQAFTSVKDFANQFSGSQEIQMMLVELLRAASREDEAREQLEKLAGQLDVLPQPEEAAPSEARGAPEPRLRARAGGLVFLDTGLAVPAEAPTDAEPPDGLQVTEPAALEPAAAGEVIIEPLPTAPDEDLPALEGLEQIVELDIDVSGAMEPSELELDQPMADSPVEGLVELDGSPELDGEPVELELGEDRPPTTGLPLIEVGAPTGSISELESRVLDDPDNPELHRELADALAANGDEPRALEELELGLAGHERLEDWGRASQLANRLVLLAPENIRYHQKRVELAYRTGDRTPLLDAYLSLGDALARAGAKDKAIAVYGRVREHDPDNPHAAVALAALAETESPAPPRRAAPPAVHPPAMHPPAQPPEPTPPAPQAPPPVPAPVLGEPAPVARGGGEAFVDLGSMILEGDGPRDTRMRVDRREPEDQDEQREFQEILEQFKRGIEQNIDTEDYQAHYDLGIAFKEMGLLDEAIAEFQKALRAPEGRLRTSEALGLCFFEKGQHAIAETVLRRAVETLEGGDEAKIGLLYWLGRAAEAQRKDGEAISSYERALAVDIRFMDLGERIHRLSAGGRG